MTVTRALQNPFLAAVCFCALCATASAADETRLVIWYDRQDGSAYLKNNSPTDSIQFASYSISSDFGDLLPGDYDGVQGWKALEDIPTQFPAELDDLTAILGDGATKFGSANPSPNALAELSLSPLDMGLEPGEMWFIGKPFSNIPIDDAGHMKAGYGFSFSHPVITQQPAGAIIGAPVPEPSTGLLAALAGIGLVRLNGCVRRVKRQRS